MIYPLVIHPDVFHSLYEKDEIPKNIKNFFYKIIYDNYYKEKFFFIDDENNTLKKIYIDIIQNILPGKPLRILTDELIKQIKTLLRDLIIFKIIGYFLTIFKREQT